MSDYVFGVTGHVQHFHVGANFTNALRELASVHAGHDDVGQQQVDYSFMRHRDLHGDGAVSGLDHSVALLLEILPREGAQIGFVLDQ